MKTSSKQILVICLLTGLFFLSSFLNKFSIPIIPKTWDLKEIEEFHLPPADSTVKIKFASEEYYYALPEWEMYKTYPVFAAGKGPMGYLDSLRKLEPQKFVIDPQKMRTQEDWIKAGEAVFNWPVTNPLLLTPKNQNRFPQLGNPNHHEVTRSGIYPFDRYIITEKGVLQIATQSCASCHSRVTSEGNVIPGAQGTNDFDFETAQFFKTTKIPRDTLVEGLKSVAYTPWLKNEVQNWANLDMNLLTEAILREPEGVIVRQGTGIFTPIPIPSLIGIKDIKYLDKTGLMKNRGPGDLMRYAAFNQGMDMTNSYNGWIPIGTHHYSQMPQPKEWNHPFNYAAKRYSDVQLYALVQYLYSLKPPPNPNHYSATVLSHGKSIFIKQGCVSCHTPPFYTNNQLTPVSGYEPTAKDFKRADIFNVSVETDPKLTLASRRGTGFYKIPSLRGVWYRRNFLHTGELSTLEDLLDPNRLKDDYVPTGFIPMGVKNTAVKGHEFGLTLAQKDKSDLIAFLKTL